VDGAGAANEALKVFSFVFEARGGVARNLNRRPHTSALSADQMGPLLAQRIMQDDTGDQIEAPPSSLRWRAVYLPLKQR
jgi:hypothetical protein